MTVYAVGDIQGCLDPLKRLLDKIDFEAGRDQLWAAGDIVNRGPKSLDTLRFLKGLGDSFRMVLGNHDLHLLATYNGHRKPTRKDTLDEVYHAPDADELLAWLQHQPLLIHDLGYVMVHAGIPPQWSLATAKQEAAKVEAALRSDQAGSFFTHMYGDSPGCWRKGLTTTERLRVTTNYFTRMRFCDSAGSMELTCKGAPEEAPAGYLPWFAHPRSVSENIIFGHWAALDGKDCGKCIFPLDTGCVWGKRIRALNLLSRKYIHCQCSAS